MADYLNNVAAADTYTDAVTLGPYFAARRATVTVANAAVLVQVAVGVVGNWRWIDEREFFFVAQSFTVDRIIGIRFRNAVAGAVAQIMCALTGPADADFGVGLPFPATLSPTAGH
jgi:hypothetical protein